jgi:hypothetical protein
MPEDFPFILKRRVQIEFKPQKMEGPQTSAQAAGKGVPKLKPWTDELQPI